MTVLVARKDPWHYYREIDNTPEYNYSGVLSISVVFVIWVQRFEALILKEIIKSQKNFFIDIMSRKKTALPVYFLKSRCDIMKIPSNRY